MSEEEEAELLAHALESGAEPAAIADVLETVQAVQTRRAALLGDERAAAVLKVVEERLARARRRRMVFAGGGALAMAAALVLVFVRVERSSEPARVASAPSATQAAKSAEASGGGLAQELELARLNLIQEQRSVAEGRAPYRQSESMLDRYRDKHWIALKKRYE